MPRLIDYVGRFEFIRQAAFAVVRDDGADALSRRRVAAELGTGVNTIRRSVADWADLARLAADHVHARRRLGRLSRRTADPIQAAEYLVRSLMPEDLTHLDEELVWLKLVVACALTPSGLEPPGQLKREFGIAQRGYDDGVPATEEAVDMAGAGRVHRRAALQPYVDARDEDLRRATAQILDLMEVPEPRDDVGALLIAVVEGLTLSACLGRIAPENATQLAIGHVARLDSGRRDGPSRAPQSGPG
jgi:hypothetical protein